MQIISTTARAEGWYFGTRAKSLLGILEVATRIITSIITRRIQDACFASLITTTLALDISTQFGWFPVNQLPVKIAIAISPMLTVVLDIISKSIGIYVRTFSAQYVYRVIEPRNNET